MPDLHIAEIELNQDGLVNDVVTVNGEFVFRFAKTEHDADALAREMTILDFGTAGVGDAAQDFGTLLSAYGEQFVVKMGVTYPGLDRLLSRASFRAQAIELQWVLNGIESGENFWFTAHLGRARDLRPQEGAKK